MWKKLKKKKEHYPPVKLTLCGKPIRRRLYGVGRCFVAGVPCVAVKAGKKRHISSQEGATLWLTLNGLSEAEATAFVTEGLERFDEREVTL